MRRVVLTLTVLGMLGAQVPAPRPTTDTFAGLRFLEGEWKGESAGLTGPSSGAAIFRFDLEGRVCTRRSYADTAATNGRPASHHEDLMTVFSEGGQLKALYVDNEDHVIHYLVTSGPTGVTFTSEAAPGPRFRLSYVSKSASVVTVRFEIAPPQTPEAFKIYLEADTRKVK
ncbi:hypothetical protein [Geothrix sp. PMB-07]|uniref:hypothetical protein n=1 Tax=Geothrix sp. PMB-07 TaxID=3068640 RepID=UPI00274268C6|nr:hypothetical protein [Geothrix sp. PMB-07]WLT30192.1 hypothetical protein Q9293_10730 [Geothrix sp. PMB-07]